MVLTKHQAALVEALRVGVSAEVARAAEVQIRQGKSLTEVWRMFNRAQDAVAQALAKERL